MQAVLSRRCRHFAKGVISFFAVILTCKPIHFLSGKTFPQRGQTVKVHYTGKRAACARSGLAVVEGTGLKVQLVPSLSFVTPVASSALYTHVRTCAQPCTCKSEKVWDQ